MALYIPMQPSSKTPISVSLRGEANDDELDVRGAIRSGGGIEAVADILVREAKAGRQVVRVCCRAVVLEALVAAAVAMTVPGPYTPATPASKRVTKGATVPGGMKARARVT